MTCFDYLRRVPSIHPSAFVAPSADVVGDVTIHEDASIWYQVVLRGDINRIVVGPRSNVQDGTIVHLADDYGTFIGADVTVGHRAIIHACTIGNEVLIGMGAVVMDGSEIGERCLIGAGALVTKGQKIPSGSLVLGSPAKVIRALDVETQRNIRKSAVKYVEVARRHKARLGRIC